MPTESLRLLTVLTAYPPMIGGVQLHAQELCDRLASDGVPVHVATAWKKGRRAWLRGTTVGMPRAAPPEARPSGVTVHQLSLTAGERARSAAPALVYYTAMGPMRPPLTAIYRRTVREVLDRSRPSIAHLHRIGREGMYEAFVEALEERGIPWVLTPHHHPHWVRRRDAWWWDLYRRAHRVFVLSGTEASQLEAGGVDPSRIVRVVNGPVDVPARPVPERSVTRVIFLAQVRRYKGIELVADAVDEVRASGLPVELDVVGPWVEPLRRLRRRLDASDHVTVHGPVDPATKRRLLEDATVLCVPSTQEAMGMVYLEAWAVGRPVVGLDIPPVRELFDRTGGGLLVDRSARDVARALRSLLEDADQRRSLADSGHRAVQEEFNWQEAARRTREVYTDLLGAATDLRP